MKNRFSGWSKTRIATMASVEAGVSAKICYLVLFKGYPIASNATRHVELWAKREGFRILPPRPGRRVEEPDVVTEGSSVEANIGAAERKLAEYDARIISRGK